MKEIGSKVVINKKIYTITSVEDCYGDVTYYLERGNRSYNLVYSHIYNFYTLFNNIRGYVVEPSFEK